jgi:hypothetical protein
MDVLTRRYDNARSGVNLRETNLKKSNVKHGSPTWENGESTKPGGYCLDDGRLKTPHSQGLFPGFPMIDAVLEQLPRLRFAL